jgi:hypothetical protein
MSRRRGLVGGNNGHPASVGPVVMRSGGAACEGRPGPVSPPGRDALEVVWPLTGGDGAAAEDDVRVAWPPVQAVRPNADSTVTAISRPRCTGP